jgi:hypothetical protein
MVALGVEFRVFIRPSKEEVEGQMRKEKGWLLGPHEISHLGQLLLKLLSGPAQDGSRDITSLFSGEALERILPPDEGESPLGTALAVGSVLR